MASTREWFETVAEAQRRARRQLPRSVYLALVAGAEAGVTMDDNVAAFGELRLRPHVADLPVARELGTEVMGQQVSLPVLLSPTGVQAVHPDGEVAVARAAAAAGTAMGLSSFASKPVEEVGQAVDKLLFQSYWVGSREDILARAERARAAGATGLIVTLDWVFDSRRDWGSPWIPERLNLQAMLRYAPQVAVKPGYLARWLRSGSLPDLGVPNLGARGAPVPSFFGAYGQWMGSAPPGLGRPGLAAFAVGWAIHDQGHHPGGRRAPRGGRRGDRDLGVQPRRQQPRLHPGHNPLLPPSPTRSATRSRCCWTAASAGAATWSRRWPWARGR